MAIGSGSASDMTGLAAGISQVMKHITINRPQMASITKSYLTLQKKLLFVFVV